MDPHILPGIDSRVCDGCGQCVPACPTGALAVIAGRVVLLHPDRCTYDAACELACPRGAIRVPYAIVFGEVLDGS